MSIWKIIDWGAATAEGDLVGTIASEFYQLYDDAQNWTWACDVDIGEEEVLRNVPVATNNREVIYAQEGMPVALKRIGKGRYAIVGLAKKIKSTTHIIYVQFEEGIGSIVGEELVGYMVRLLTYGELQTYGGYGVVPYGARGRFNAAGELIEILGSY
jgi:hypothetical protein